MISLRLLRSFSSVRRPISRHLSNGPPSPPTDVPEQIPPVSWLHHEREITKKRIDYLEHEIEEARRSANTNRGFMVGVIGCLWFGVMFLELRLEKKTNKK